MKKTMKRLLLLFSNISIITVACVAQTMVRGRVLNSATNETFAGSRVVLVGTKTMTMTEDDGTFELKVDQLDGMLRVEAPGFETQIVPLLGRSEICVRLLPVLKMRPVLLNADDAAGRALLGDVRIAAHSGLDAAGSAMFIRGLHSINMTSQPLFVVDGQIWQSQENMSSLHEGYFNNPLALLSVDDIESIQVLKNGTAIWGAKAAGGVVMINTKRSHNMATEIEVNLSTGIKQRGKVLPLLQADDYRILASELLTKDKSMGSGVGSLYRFLDDDPTTSYYKANHNHTDWNHEITRVASTQNYGIAVRGGDEVALYAFSLGYNRADGNIRHTDFERLNVRFNSDINLTKQLTTRADIAFSQVTRNLVDDGIFSATSPRYMAYTKNPLYNAYQYDTQGRLYHRLSDVDELNMGNPLAVVENGEGKSKNYRFTATLAPTYRFGERFSLSAVAAFSWDKIKESAFTPDFGLPEVHLYNSQGDWYGDAVNSVASLMTRHSTMTLGMNADWSILHSRFSLLSTKIGFRYLNNTFEGDYGQGYNTGSDNLRSLSVTNSALRTTLGINDDWRSMSWYAQAEYSLRNRYMITACAAMETNSRFGRDADGGLKLGGVRWGLFPSVDAAWQVTNERFMRHISGIDYLKLHLGYELTGNDQLPIGATHTCFETINYAGLAKGLALASIGNEKLKWEQTGTMTLGVDMRLLNNRLSLRADYFHATTYDLLVTKQLQEEYGLKDYWTNDGQLQNDGFEMAVSGRVIDKRDWQLTAGLCLGHYKNKVKKLTDGDYMTKMMGANLLTSVGKPIGLFYGYRTEGVFVDQAAASQAHLAIVDETGKVVPFAAGDVHFSDITPDGIINEKDMTVIGDPNPDIYGSFNFAMKWKRLSVDVLFSYSLGNDAYNALRQQLESGATLNNQSEAMRRRWTADGQTTDIPRVTFGDPMQNNRFSDRWIEDASYLKLKQLSLAYDVPVKLSFIQSLQLWGSLNNMFTLTRYLGADPEFSYGNHSLLQGVDAGLMPQSRSYNIGIKLNL